MAVISNILGKASGRRLKTLMAEANRARQRQNWSVAAEKYAAALAFTHDKFGLLVQLGHMQKEAGHFEDAEKSYAEALSLRPADWDLHVQFGHLFNRAGTPDKALEWYKKALALRPDDRETLTLVQSLGVRAQSPMIEELRRIALQEMDSRQFEAALPKVESLYTQYNLRDFDVILGHAYKELGLYEKARKLYDAYLARCLENDSKHVFDAFFQLGNICKLSGDEARALDYYIDAKSYKNRTEAFLDASDPIMQEINACMTRLYPIFLRH